MSDAKMIAEAIVRVLESPNVADSNWEQANVVDVIHRLATCVRDLAGAVTPLNAMPGPDAMGGNVASLTEAVMGNAAATLAIASSIDNLAEAIRDSASR